MAVMTDPQAEGEPGVVLELPAVPQSVRSARNAVSVLAERHGAAPETVEDIRLAVSEAASNCVLHAYGGDGRGQFRLLAIAGGGELVVVIEDDGCGLDIESPNPGLGVGQKVIEQTAAQVFMATRPCGGATVQLSFALGS